jgi:hypothetical protein
MASAGTLISDLDGKTPVLNQDDDLVSRILADINHSSQGNPAMNAPPPMSSQPPASMGRVINSPNPNTTYPTAVDPGTATAHIIGKDYPTGADFANLMHSPSYTHGGSQFASVSQQQGPVQTPHLIQSAKGNMYSDILTQVKQPLFVAIIVFLINLPIINVLIGHYLPSLLRGGGDLTTVGMLVKASLGGFLFWFIQKIVVPLMTV